MTKQPKSAEGLRIERIVANCKKIWGQNKVFDLDIETDDYLNYIAYIKEYQDFDYKLLAMTPVCFGKDAAWRRMECITGAWVRALESAKPMSKEDRLQIHSGPNGPWRGLLEKVIDFEAELDRQAATKENQKS